MGIRINRLLQWKRRNRMSSAQVIAIAFALIILTGSILLSLPVASRSGVSCGFRPALFTATSATCVTGLTLFDTWSQWTLFGQIVILSMIEIGGLGFMSAASMAVFLLRKKVGLRQRMLMAQALSMDEMDGVVRLQKWVLFGSLSVQLVGALVLFFRFLPQLGWKLAAWWGVFHSVSAFCNAGFDVMGSVSPGASVIPFNNDPLVLITLMALIIIGGLGFFVWDEVIRLHRFKKFSVYTKMVLLTTGVLILSGAALILALEWSNPGTFGAMSVPQKILNAFFQSVTTRTAGFAGVDQGMLTESGKGISLTLMLIGGSSGSTAGGIKTVTMVVLLLFVWTRCRRKGAVTVYKHTISDGKVMDAMTIISIMVLLALFGGVFISASSGVSFTDGLFEAISALATVGLTTGVTGELSIAAQILVIIYMYFGRVGVLTLSLGFLMGNRAEERFQYAQTNLLIG